MSRSVVHWKNSKEERKLWFEKGKSDFPEYNNPNPLGSYRSKEYNDGHNFMEGYLDYPEFKCVYRKNKGGYNAYVSGFERKKQGIVIKTLNHKK